MSDLSLTAPAAGSTAPRAAGWTLPWWPLLLLGTALLYALMPVIHHAVYGPERILDAAAVDISARVGAELSEGGRRMLAAQFALAPTLTGALTAFAWTLLTVVIAGAMVNVGTTLALSNVTPAQALQAAAGGAFAVAVLRVGLWGLLLWTDGLDGLRGVDWLARGSVSLAIFAPDTMDGLPLYALSAADLTLCFGTALSALLLTAADRKLGFVTAVVASLGWPLTVLAARVGLSAYLGFPVG